MSIAAMRELKRSRSLPPMEKESFGSLLPISAEHKNMLRLSVSTITQSSACLLIFCLFIIDFLFELVFRTGVLARLEHTRVAVKLVDEMHGAAVRHAVVMHECGRLLESQFACLAYHGAERDSELDGDVLVLGGGEVCAQVVEHGFGPIYADGCATMLNGAPHALVEEDAVGLLAVSRILLALYLPGATLAVGGVRSVLFQIEIAEPEVMSALGTGFLAWCHSLFSFFLVLR